MEGKMMDAISRSAVLDIIKEERRFIESLRETAFDNEDRAHNTGELGCAIRIARKIKDIPALDAAPVVHARWIPIKLYGGDHAIKCSACNNCDNPSKVPGRYCWQCGAQMDGEADV